MIENQHVQKSSVNPQSQDYVGPVYLDSCRAIEDFELDAPEKSSAPVMDSRVSRYITNARVLMKHNELPLALNLLRQASNIDSKNPQTLELLGACLEKAQNFSEALIVRRALATIDKCFETYFHYGTVLYKVGRDQEALEKYYEALVLLKEENDNLFELYKNMGNIFVRQGDFDAAEEHYNKAYTMNSKSDVLLVNFGTLEVQRNDFDKSLYCFRRAVEVNPHNDKAWVGLAMVHNQVGDSELAWANIESALDINAENRTAVLLASNWGLRDGKVLRSIEILQEYLAAVEQDEDMSLVLINHFCTVGDYSSALLEIERVLLWNPNHQEVRELKKKLQVGSKAA